MQVQKTRNYIGLIGAILALIGFFCPFVKSQSSWDFANFVVEHDFGEYYESAKTFSEISIYFYAAYLLFLVAAGIAFLLAYHKTGASLTALPTALFLILFLQEGPELVSLSNIGFLLSGVGIIVMLLANSLVGLNQTLFPHSVFYCNLPQKSDSDMNKTSSAGVCNVNKNSTRGYVGIIGAVMTLIGFFLPYVTILWVSVSFYDYFCSEMSPFLAIIYIALLIGIGVAYFFYRHTLGCLLSIPYAIYFVVCTFSETAILEAGQSGYWLTVVGVILMLISPYITKKFSK